MAQKDTLKGQNMSNLAGCKERTPLSNMSMEIEAKNRLWISLWMRCTMFLIQITTLKMQIIRTN